MSSAKTDGVKWTPEQLEAIQIRGADTLVSAAAGSGKTAVLVERVIAMITDPQRDIDIDQLLVVTFTNAAARQMKDKIARALVKRIEQFPADPRYRRQLMLLNNASINTIHAFCLDVIRSHFQKTDLPFDFEVGQQAELDMLKTEALEETFEDFYESEEVSGRFQDFIDYFGNRDDKPVMELVQNVYGFINSIPFYQDWLAGQAAALSADEGLLATKWGEYILSYAAEQLTLAEEIMEHAVGITDAYGEEHGVLPYGETFSEDMQLVEKLKGSLHNDWDGIVRAFGGATFSTLKRMGKGGDRVLAEELKQMREQVKKIVTGLRDNYFYQEERVFLEDLRAAAPYLAVLTELLMAFDARYTEKKRRRSLVDFNDFEHICLSILAQREEDGKITPSDVAVQLRERYAEVLIDEYQDTNSMQEIILTLVAGPQKRFMVGDIKQSIYRFRNAKPALFLQKYQSYARTDGSGDRRLLLSKNFRSAAPVLSFVNFLFSHLMCAPAAGLDYTEEEALYFGGGYPELALPVDICILDKSAEDEEGPSLGGSTQKEACICAERIRALVDSGFMIYDSGIQADRPCEYRDFTVLMRSMAAKADVYAEVFAQYHIPYFLEQGSGYFQSLEVRAVISLLQVIDNPLQDIPLLAVLRSAIFHFSDDELVKIRLCDTGALYYDCVRQASGGGDEHCRLFLERLDKWREYALYLPVNQLLNRIYEEAGLLALYGGMSGGKTRGDNLRLLADWARQFERTSYKGLFHFISFLQKQMEQAERSLSLSSSFGETNAVTIMTVHKSKGLEANIVLLTDCGKRFNMQDLYSRLLYDEEMGFGPDFADTENRVVYPTAAKNAIALKQRRETLAEEMRLLYVALTRARQKLILVGSYQNASNKLHTLYAQMLSRGDYAVYAAQNAGCYLDWVLLPLMCKSDAEALREGTSGILKLEECDFSVSLQFYTPGSIGAPLLPKKPERQEAATGPSENYREVSQILSYRYPFSEAGQIPAKLTVSEMKRRFDLAESDERVVYYPREIDFSNEIQAVPRFLEKEQALAPAARGIAYHTAMQYLDFGRIHTKEEIVDALDALCERGLLTPEERAVIATADLYRFACSDICREIASSAQVWREQSFLLPLSSGELFDGTDEVIMVQGVIDCIYRKDGGYYLVDYKTDLAPRDMVAARYRVQMELYGRAVEKLFGQPPRKRYLYLLRTGESMEV